MALKEKLIQNLENIVENFEFPFWENGEENAYTGIMKMTGFSGVKRLDLVIQTFEYSINENCIQTLIYHISSEKVEDFVVSVDWDTTPHLDFSRVNLDTTHSLLFSGEKEINVDLQTITTEQKLFESEITPQSILFWAVDNVNPNNLFCTENELCKILKIHDVTTVFDTYEWYHPDFNEVMIDEKKIFDYSDISNGIELLAGNINYWEFGSQGKTDWRNVYL